MGRPKGTAHQAELKPVTVVEVEIPHDTKSVDALSVVNHHLHDALCEYPQKQWYRYRFFRLPPKTTRQGVVHRYELFRTTES